MSAEDPLGDMLRRYFLGDMGQEANMSEREYRTQKLIEQLEGERDEAMDALALIVSTHDSNGYQDEPGFVLTIEYGEKLLRKHNRLPTAGGAE